MSAGVATRPPGFRMALARVHLYWGPLGCALVPEASPHPFLPDGSGPRLCPAVGPVCLVRLGADLVRERCPNPRGPVPVTRRRPSASPPAPPPSPPRPGAKPTPPSSSFLVALLAADPSWHTSPLRFLPAASSAVLRQVASFSIHALHLPSVTPSTTLHGSCKVCSFSPGLHPCPHTHRCPLQLSPFLEPLFPTPAPRTLLPSEMLVLESLRTLQSAANYWVRVVRDTPEAPAHSSAASLPLPEAEETGYLGSSLSPPGQVTVTVPIWFLQPV